MRIGTFQQRDQRFVGVVEDERVMNVASILGECTEKASNRFCYSDLRVFLEEIGLERLRASLMKYPMTHAIPIQDVTVLAPLLHPGKFLCIGLNYRDHAAESEMKLPAEPLFFNKFATSIIGPGATIVLPSNSEQVDYEAELSVVIGKRGKSIPEEEALSYVAGYTICNDISARDLQFQDGQWVKGKALDTFAPLGPYLVSADAVGDPSRLGIRLWVNNRLMQDATTADMIFPVARIISYLSRFFTLEPGDVIATGTPPGVGFARKPPVFLQTGDTVTIEIEQVGKLENRVGRE